MKFFNERVDNEVERETQIQQIRENISIVELNTKTVNPKLVKFGTKENFIRNNMLKPNFKCDHCDINFQSFSILENNKIQANIAKQLKCDQCENIFYSIWRLK